MAHTIQSIKKQVYESILADILAGAYSPATLLTEPALIAKYAVSKTSVREALVQLCSEGVLKSLPRCGYQLAQVSVTDIHDLLDLRVILELGALEKTAGRFSNDQAERLYAVLDKKPEEKNDHSILNSWNRNMSFHLTLCSLCGNMYLYKNLDHLFKMCSLGANQSFLKTWGEKMAEGPSRNTHHRTIIESLQSGNLVEAKTRLKSDILSMKNDLLFRQN